MDYLTALFISTSIQLQLPPNLLEAICYVESKHAVGAIHYNDGDGNSVGLCQIKYKTSQWLGFKGTEEGLMEPRVNIYYAGLYLKYQLRRYNSINRAVIAYNYGHAKNLTTTKYQAKVYSYWRQN